MAAKPTKPTMPTLKLADEIERLEDEFSIEVKLDDGSTLRIPPPELWPDEARDIWSDPKKDDRDLGRAILGDEGWDRFTANRGTGSMFAHLLAKRYQLTLGESSASSSS